MMALIFSDDLFIRLKYGSTFGKKGQIKNRVLTNLYVHVHSTLVHALS